MRATWVLAIVAAASAVVASGQTAPEATPQSTPEQQPKRQLKLSLEPLYSPSYKAARELRLALWDSSMSRLELAVAQEMWAGRNPGPTRLVFPLETMPPSMRLRFGSEGQPLLMGPWSKGWDKLTWQEKIGAGAQTTFVLWGLVEILGHAF